MYVTKYAYIRVFYSILWPYEWNITGMGQMEETTCSAVILSQLWREQFDDIPFLHRRPRVWLSDHVRRILYSEWLWEVCSLCQYTGWLLSVRRVWSADYTDCAVRYCLLLRLETPSTAGRRQIAALCRRLSPALRCWSCLKERHVCCCCGVSRTMHCCGWWSCAGAEWSVGGQFNGQQMHPSPAGLACEWIIACTSAEVSCCTLLHRSTDWLAPLTLHASVIGYRRLAICADWCCG